MSKFIDWFLHSGTSAARLARTLVEVSLSFLLANIGDIFGLFTISPTVKGLIISFGTLILTAIIGFINDNKTPEKTEE